MKAVSVMSRPVKIAASIMCANLLNLQRDISIFNRLKVDLLHIDIMDGHFVPNITLGIDLANQISRLTTIPKEIHLLVKSPNNFVDSFLLSNKDTLIVHVESNDSMASVIDKLRKRHKKVGIAVNPETKLNKVIPFLNQVNQLVIMTAKPGFSGQNFIESMTQKVADASSIINKRHLNIDIEVDGDVSLRRIKQLWRGGANIFVAGTSTLFKNNNLPENFRRLHKLTKGLQKH